jgi:hypothetical protein
VPGAERHAQVDVLGAHPGLLLQGDGAEEVGEEQAVDHEAGQIGHFDGGLAERLAEPAGALAGAVGRGLREGELDELHLRDRVEDVQADEAVLRARGPGEALDRQRRRRARQQRVVAGDHAEVAQDAGLDLLVLADRLDDGRGLAERVEIGLHAHVGGVDLAAQAPADRVHAAARALCRAVGSRPQHDLAVARRRRCEAARDRAAARYAESFMHPAIAPG